MTLEQHAETENRTIAFKDPVIEFNGEKVMKDAKGYFVPLELVKPAKKLEDDTVRKMLAFAVDLNAQIARFKDHCFEDIGAFEAILAEQYDAKVGGPKGNLTMMSFDGCMRVELKVANIIDFGPELQAAKSLLDECMNEWTANTRPEIRAIITRAFNTDKEGQINRAEIFMLLRLDIEDKRWLRAMDAIRDAIRVIGTKHYILFKQRDNVNGEWKTLPIHMAKV